MVSITLQFDDDFSIGNKFETIEEARQFVKRTIVSFETCSKEHDVTLYNKHYDLHITLTGCQFTSRTRWDV
jgi:hypothetical protein